MRHDLLLQAAIDEVDQALAGLQTTRQLLHELQRNSQVLQRTGRPGPATDRGASPAQRPSGLRYSGMTVAEAARALSLSEEHVRRLLRRGELEGIAFGGRIGWRLSRDYVADLVAQQRAAEQALHTSRRGHDEPPPRER